MEGGPPLRSVPPGAGRSWGRGQRFGRALLPGGRAYVFATATVPEGGRSPEGEVAELRRRFADWHDPVPGIVEALREEDVLRNDVFDRPPPRRCTRGRVALLGDAAHPMTPDLGQGACQALEDAVVLGRYLAAAGGGTAVVRALRAWERERMRRVRPLVRRSRQVGRMGQWERPLAMRVRASVARRLLPRLQERSFAALLHFGG